MAAIIRGFRFGYNDFLITCKNNYASSAPFERKKCVAGAEIKNSENLKRFNEFCEIPQMDFREILFDIAPAINLSLSKHEDGMLPLDQAIVLLAILVKENPKVVLEIGTFMGHTTKLMSENLQDSIIHTVDLPVSYSADTDSVKDLPKSDYHLIERRKVGKHFINRTSKSRIVQHFADTANWDFREAGKPTFFFIDGSHTYEYCKNDSEKCLGLCTGGETFFWHDCEELHPGVVKLIAEWRGLGRNIVRINGTSLAYWKKP